ncbi:uncharacterized protein LOC108137959 [Drosophila elegans]|uniref:uncharacterized protein LOC108137959 n=1 Tax=Drosophila elegans TaxID=30023 RepID=UPI0007E814DE|nr:uncharacterized protein LOC108137959 [Drosophila elegans]
MSAKESLALQLADPQLAKLTSESEEIRLRALEQVETRFIRCLQLDEHIQFKPVLLLKQLIRWFGHTPPLAADRVLAIILELLRSEYGETVVRKIPYARLKTELEKVRRVLRDLNSKRVTELLDDLQLLLLQKYKMDLATPSISSLSAIDLTSQTNQSQGNESVASGIDQLLANLKPEDFETAWTRPCLDDVASMTSMIDMPRVGAMSVLELQVQLTHLTIRMGDYPAEYFLQSPYIFLHLVHLQNRNDGSLLYVNRALIECLKQLQRRIQLQHNTLSYAASLDPPATRPQQLRVSSALGVLLVNCTKLISPLLFCPTNDNWHILELSMECVRTYDVLGSRALDLGNLRIAKISKQLVTYNNSLEGSDLNKLVDTMVVSRLQSLIFHGLLKDTVILSLNYDKQMDQTHAKSLIKRIIWDSSNLSCQPDRVKSLSGVIRLLSAEPSLEEQHLIKLKRCYSLALNQLRPNTRMGAVQLIQVHRQVCMVVDQLGSETLVKQLFDAVVECTPLYAGDPKLREDAEKLIFILMHLPDPHLRGFVYRLMPRPVVSHFHAFMNKTVYMTGCSNLELVRHHILGLPLNTQILQGLILQSMEADAPEQVRQWCIDYPIMLLKLSCLLNATDFGTVFQLILPVLPLLICKSVSYKQLHKLIWELFEPDTSPLDPTLMLRGYVYYMFHPDSQLRSDAATRIAFVLQCQDYTKKYKPTMNQVPIEMLANDFCLIQPPVNYSSIFDDHTDEPFQGQRSLDALIRLLQTKDLRPPIRKSTMIQLNVLLQNWKACDDFATKEDGYRLLLETLHNALKKESANDPADVLLPAVSILMKLLLHDAGFRQEVANTFEVYVCLLRALYMLPHETQLRQDVSICLFQMLFHNYINSQEGQLVLDVELGPMILPVTYEVNDSPPATVATEGIALQEHLENTHFGGDKERAAHHWRLYMAHCIRQCQASITLEAMRNLDIRDCLKMNVHDLALEQASDLDLQLGRQLTAAGNCSSHEDLQQIVTIIQMFLMLMRSAIPQKMGERLWKLVHKYIRLAPGNDADRELYKYLLELCLTCLRHRQPQVMSGLSKALETDHHHSFHLQLHDRLIPLETLHLISQCLVQLLSAECHGVTMNWHGKLFMQLSLLAKTHFELRQLQHVRCVLSILRHLSERQLSLSAVQLMQYCQHFIQLSSDLRTSTHTGSQWQRDCLHIICQLHMHKSRLSAKTNSTDDAGVAKKVLRYLLGLCGHSDGEVRALAWVSMANWITSCGASMASILPSLDFLPGGLPACCLTTLLDIHEVMLVRELAGRVFILLMPTIGAEASIELLRNHDFLKDAYNALRVLHVAPCITKEAAGEQHSCEIVGCFVAICIQMVDLKPEWCATLCEHSFMSGLSDVMKTPTPTPPPTAPPSPPPAVSSLPFLELCVGQICQLYALCHRDNFEFLQRTICRDSVLLQSFLSLTNNVLNLESPERLLVQLFKLFLVFSKDPNASAFLDEQLRSWPALFLDFFLYGLHMSFINTTLQRYTLSALSMVFIKAHNVPETDSLIRELERYELKMDEILSFEEEELADGKDEMISMKKQLLSWFMQSDAGGDAQIPTADIKASNAAVLLYHRLDALFDRHYPPRTFHFLQAPGANHVQICETFGGLLKISPCAVQAAGQMMLLDRVIHLLETFLDDPVVGNACVYVKRVGAHKSRDILSNLLLLINMLGQWHSSHHAVITQPAMAATLVRILIRIWPWLSHSPHLKEITVTLIMFLTEHSFEMCKQTSLLTSGQSHSLLQLMVRVADFETTRKETPNREPNQSVVPALRAMANCCSCAEGRLSLAKMHVVDMFDTILPENPSAAHATKVRPVVLIAWLGFWEVFSRYDVGSKACHLHALVNTIRRSTPLSTKRILCLRILRNMSFFNSNRSQLVEQSDFINLLRDILIQPVEKKAQAGENALDSFAEHCLAVLMLWKLFGFGAKYKGMLRGTKLYKVLIGLRVDLSDVYADNPHKFSDVPYAKDLAKLLENLAESMRQ